MKSIPANKTTLTISREHGNVHFDKTSVYSGVSFPYSVSSKPVFQVEKTAQIPFTSLQTLNRTTHVTHSLSKLRMGKEASPWEGAQPFDIHKMFPR